MYKSNRLIAIIPARGGSKGLARKNVVPLMGRPLVEWTIYAAKNSRYLDKIIVSTDDAEIANISRSCGAEVPFLRPSRLASDKSLITDVVLYTIDRLREGRGPEWNYVVLLQPTSPLRSGSDIDSAIEEFFSHRNINALASVSEVCENPFWMQVITKQGILKNMLRSGKRMDRRQDLPKIYRVNGAIYISKSSVLRKKGTFCPDKTIPYIMSGDKSVDIDNMEDLLMAEIIMKRSRVRRPGRSS